MATCLYVLLKLMDESALMGTSDMPLASVIKALVWDYISRPFLLRSLDLVFNSI